MTREKDSLNGKLLVASTRLEHPAFWRTVVLILDHGTKGAIGVVVNRPTETRVDSVLPGWGVFGHQPNYVFRGGPVADDSALALATAEGDSDHLRPVGPGIVNVVDLDAQPEELSTTLNHVRVFAGYAGWSAGQLEDEIAEGSWHIVESKPHDVFTTDPEALWADILRRQGGNLAMLATFPSDPSLN